MERCVWQNNLRLLTVLIGFVNNRTDDSISTIHHVCQHYISLDNIVQCLGSWISSDHQLYNVLLLDAVQIVIWFIYNLTHVTTITHNYFLRCATCTHLTIIHFPDYNHLFHSYTFAQFKKTTL
jgi:hypothetical protein